MSQEKACANCRYAVKYVPAGQITGHLQCRWGPPAVIVMMAPGRMAGEVSQNVISVAPPLPGDYWCHQYSWNMGEATLVVTQNVPVASAKPVIKS